MNSTQRQLCETLRQKSENEAFEWLRKEFPADHGDLLGQALFLIPHRSWSKESQVSLFKLYFIKAFPSGSRTLDCFVKIMSPRLLLDMIKVTFLNSMENNEKILRLSKYRLQSLDRMFGNEELDNDLSDIYATIDAKLEILRAERR